MTYLEIVSLVISFSILWIQRKLIVKTYLKFIQNLKDTRKVPEKTVRTFLSPSPFCNKMLQTQNQQKNLEKSSLEKQNLISGLSNQNSLNNGPFNFSEQYIQNKQKNYSGYLKDHTFPTHSTEKLYKRVIFSDSKIPDLHIWENAVKIEENRIKSLLKDTDFIESIISFNQKLFHVYPTIKEIEEPLVTYAFLRFADDYLPETIDVFEEAFLIAENEESKNLSKYLFMKQIQELFTHYQRYIDRAKEYRKSKQRANGEFLARLDLKNIIDS